MEHGIDLFGFIDNTLSPDQKKKAEKHIKTCQKCRDDLAYFEAHIDLISQLKKVDPDIYHELFSFDEDELGQPVQEIPLPGKIKQILAKHREENRLSQITGFLNLIKKEGSLAVRKAAEGLEKITRELLTEEPARKWSYAMDTKINLPERTGIEFRDPMDVTQVSFAIDTCKVNLDFKKDKLCMILEKENMPAMKQRIQITRRSGKSITAETDENGKIEIET